MELHALSTFLRAIFALVAMLAFMPAGVSMMTHAHGEMAWLQRRLGFTFALIGCGMVFGFLVLLLTEVGAVDVPTSRSLLVFDRACVALAGIDFALFWYRRYNHSNRGQDGP